MRLWPFGRRKKARKHSETSKSRPAGGPERRSETMVDSEGIPSNYEKAVNLFKERLRHSDDFIAREILLGDPPGTRVAMLYIQGLSSKEHQSRMILEDAMLLGRITEPRISGDGNRLLELLQKRYVAFAEVKRVNRFEEALLSILIGETILVVDGATAVLVVDTKGWDKRGIDEPATEAVIRGPRDGFIETMRVNVATIRRRLRTPDLAVRQMRVGRRTKTDISLMYLVDVANPSIVEEVQRRLTGLEIDGIIESGYIEMLITECPFSLFPLVERTERPDKVAASLLEGRVAIVVDNTPFVLLIPATAATFFQASEDYYENPLLGTGLRLLRIMAFLAAIFATGVYVAAVEYHQELIPFSLLLRVVGTHEGIPFQTLPTALMMEGVLEVLREAGVRLPRPVGQAVSIVGAIIIGEAAVTAGFAPPGMVIVVAFSTIAGFTLPGFGMSVAFRIIRFIAILAAGVLGLFGLGIVAMFVLVHVCSLKSFGVPFLGPFDAGRLHELGDKFVALPPQFRPARRPVWSKGNVYRQGLLEGSPPAPRKQRDHDSNTENDGGERSLGKPE